MVTSLAVMTDSLEGDADSGMVEADPGEHRLELIQRDPKRQVPTRWDPSLVAGLDSGETTPITPGHRAEKPRQFIERSARMVIQQP